jgi:glycolate oxidase
LELMDRATIRAVDDVHRLGLDRDAAAMLLIESDLPGVAATGAMETAARAAEGAGASATLLAADEREADWLRQGRRMAFTAMERLGVARMEDVGVPRGRVPELLTAIERVAADQGLRVATFGHVGDGNLHPNIILDRDDPDGEAKLKRATDALYRAAVELGGTVTAEHGVGVARRDYLELQRGSDAVALMRAIKTALDPLGILNPGKVLPEA